MKVKVTRIKNFGPPTYRLEAGDGFSIEFTSLGKLLNYEGTEPGAAKIDFSPVRQALLEDVLIGFRPDLKHEDLCFSWSQ